MPQIVSAALKAKAWIFEAKAGPDAKAIKFVVEIKARSSSRTICTTS